MLNIDNNMDMLSMFEEIEMLLKPKVRITNEVEHKLNNSTKI